MLWQLVLVTATAAPLSCTHSPPAISSRLSQVWGPGLRAHVALPARYFYIQAVATHGANFTSSPTKDTFQVRITAPGEQYTRVGVQLLDRKDGSFLVRYRVYASYQSLQIEVTVGGKHVADSPYFLEGPVYSEECYCPESNSELWLSNMACEESIPQIEDDLKHFPVVDPDKIAVEIPERFGQRQSLCHYTIKDNKIYIKTYGEHVGFRIFMDSFLLSLARKVKIPDVEFFVNLGDWPLEKKKVQPIHPIFSWCGSTDTKDIVMPTYDLTDSVLETMGRVSLDMMSVQGNTGPKWEEKNGTAFWRGRDSCKERLELVKMSRKHPDMIDAAFTHFFFFKHDESLYGPIVQPVSFFDFFKYKYQILIDGTVAAYRMPYLLSGNSVILKQDSIYYEHFYSQLQPWKHYVPFKKDLSDLLEKIQWVKDHDSEAKKIALAGQEFARNNLMGDHVFCYYFKLFQAYSKLQVSEPKIREGMEIVEHSPDNFFPCRCHRDKTTDQVVSYAYSPHHHFLTALLTAVLSLPSLPPSRPRPLRRHVPPALLAAISLPCSPASCLALI